MFGLGRNSKLGEEGKVGQKPRVGNWNVTKKDRIVKVSKMLSQIRGNKGSKKLIRYTVTTTRLTKFACVNDMSNFFDSDKGGR